MKKHQFAYEKMYRWDSLLRTQCEEFHNKSLSYVLRTMIQRRTHSSILDGVINPTLNDFKKTIEEDV